MTLLLASAGAQSKRLPIKTYTSADGLARDHVLCIVPDSHGFLWFCTPEGLSRFDGYRFTNYHTAQGLPGDSITDFLETRRGVYWVGTNGGLSRFDPGREGGSRFARVVLPGSPAGTIPEKLYQDEDGGLWCGAAHGGGLFYLGPTDAAFRAIDLAMSDASVTAILRDHQGTLWVGTSEGLYRRDRDGTTAVYHPPDGRPDSFIMALLEDRLGRLWIGTRGGLVRMDNPSGSRSMRTYTTRDGLPGDRVEAILESSDGTLWVSTNRGLGEWTPAHSQAGREFQNHTAAQGLSDNGLSALAEDRDGNLWIGTSGSGAMKVNRSGLTTYTESDGAPPALALVESRKGEMCLLYGDSDDLRIARFDGQRFTSFRPDWPAGMTYFGWGSRQIAVQDRAGEWWIATGQGLCRFAATKSVEGLAGARPKAIYSKRDGLASDNIFRVFEDCRGDIWIGTIGPDTQDGLARWDRKTETLHGFCERDGLPRKPAPTGFAEDHAGNLWISLFHEGLVRYRDGRFTTFSAADGIPGFLSTIFVDASGRLWIGTTHGLVLCGDPASDRPKFTIYSTAQGLSSNEVGGITEDRLGRIYVTTGRGIDRFEPDASGPRRMRHYTTSDGVAPGELRLAWSDRQGTLWFATPLGLSQLVPGPDSSWPAPPVIVTGLSIGGVARAISDLGERTVSGLKLPREPLRIDFSGLSFVPGETLRYQYMLTGADRDWSVPADQRSVIYAGLAAGTYRFRVRAVASDGVVSPEPATVEFTVLPPLWRTWWFLASCGLAAGAIAYGLHRYRLAQILALAHVRMHIATDLHDDIGASLSRIAILSEVARSRGKGSMPRNGDALSEIGGISRELVDAMSDIVWAINPEHDHLSNLVYRMRRFATDLLGGQGIGLAFRSSISGRDPGVGANVRRQVFLIFKEAIHNAAKHSGASRVEAELDRAGEFLVLRVRDNGRGFEPGVAYCGHGLASMRSRTAALGGTFEIETAPGKGAVLTAMVKLDAARPLAILRGRIAGRFR